MKRNRFIVTVTLGLLTGSLCMAQSQWTSNVIGQTWLAPNALFPGPPSTVAVGTGATAGYALDVHGELMTPPLGNVFKTDAPGHDDSYWRMFHLGTEYGNLFHLEPTKDFHLNAKGSAHLFVSLVLGSSVNVPRCVKNSAS